MTNSIFYPSPLGTLEVRIKNHQIYSVTKINQTGFEKGGAFETFPSYREIQKHEFSNRISIDQSILKGKLVPSTKKLSGLDKDLVQKVKLFLHCYFSGSHTQMHLPLFLRGSVFQQKVWHCLSKIPYGKTKSYSDIAQMLSSPHGARAVGSACAQNPFLILVPCHRVVAKKGLGGFALGLSAKQFLLRHEQQSK